MKILVLGSGVLGIATAYELGRRGFEVTVIDRQPGTGAETSYANGGQLSYSAAEPLANPGVLPKLPKWLLHADSPLVFRPRADMAMIRWGLQFLRNCTPARTRINCVNLLRLGLYSKQKFDELRQDTGITFDVARSGILYIYDNDHDFDHAKRHAEFQAKFGCGQNILTREGCLALEPSLAATSQLIVGGVHSYMDECGDAYLFCQALEKLIAERYRVNFRYGVTLTGLRAAKGRIVAAVTDQGEMAADGFVMAMGSYSPLYLKPLGIRLPIYPMKGYSLTLPATDACPLGSVTDISRKVVFTRLGNRLRVAGTAEFAGYDATVNEKRIAPIIRAGRALFPNMDWNQSIEKWACLRSSTPDGPPTLGKTPIPNLFLNTGHGMLGWTQAAGSAAIVADVMEGKKPGIMLHGLTMERYL